MHETVHDNGRDNNTREAHTDIGSEAIIPMQMRTSGVRRDTGSGAGVDV